MNKKFIFLLIVFSFSLVMFFDSFGLLGNVVSYKKNDQLANVNITPEEKVIVPAVPPLDVALYDQKLIELANNPIPKVVVPKKDPKGKQSSDGADKDDEEVIVPPSPNLWPVKTVYPNDGAILPFNRIIAYYGNLYSTQMGVLGQYKEDEMLARLNVEVKKWEIADPETKVVPALHYIAVVAQGSAGKDGKYRARMPDSEIDKIMAIAKKIDALVFLDVQVGFSTVEKEIPLLEKYLKMPNVHLGIDPEFSMKGTIRPGKVVGTLDAVDINFASNYLANLVKENNLTPKILIIHRYTQKMVTNYKEVKILPEVQVIMHMDGWGEEAKKINTYQQFIYKEPVQFTGFKLFYKNDVFNPGTILMTPEKLLKLNPRPIYIQYQ